MKEYDHPIHGKIVIFDNFDVDWEFHDFPTWEELRQHHIIQPARYEIMTANIIAYRDISKQRVKIFKSRFGNVSDPAMVKFILEYQVKRRYVEKDSIEIFSNRSEMLDL